MATEHYRYTDSQASARFAATCIERCLGGLELCQHAHTALVVRLAILSKTLAARSAVEQTYAELLFQSRDAFTNGRPRQLHALGGLREAACLHRLDKGDDSVQALTHTTSLVPLNLHR